MKGDLLTPVQASQQHQSIDLRPLAERMRPRNLDEVVGQDRLVDANSPFRKALEAAQVHSMILWGPPGCGKTTLALLVSKYVNAHFVALSAVTANIADVRAVVAAAQLAINEGRRTVLFVDEIHRFNKSQQDAFLPHIEKGTIVLIGATTENPSFALNSALLSRCRTYVMQPIPPNAIENALLRAINDLELGLGQRNLSAGEGTLFAIAQAADGDLRRALSLLDIACEFVQDGAQLSLENIAHVLTDKRRRFDKSGDQFYDQISALHKSVRNSHPDAALYWLARMLDGGCDPHYLARRITRMAIEDVGIADPRALTICTDAWQAYERMGSPEGDLALANAVVYLSMAPRSNAIYQAFKLAQADVEKFGTLEVPLSIRNAPTKLMQELGYGAEYHYDHDSKNPERIAYEQVCLPEPLKNNTYYKPTEQGLEIKIKEKLQAIRSKRQKPI